MVEYIDSEFTRSKTDLKLIKGYVFMLVEAAISHSSKLQSIIVLSTYKTEYVAMYEAKKEAV